MNFLFAIVFVIIIYYLIPFSMEVKHVLVILVFGSIPVIAPVFTGKCKCDEGFAGVVNSLCIPISIVIITSLLFFWQIV